MARIIHTSPDRPKSRSTRPAPASSSAPPQATSTLSTVIPPSARPIVDNTPPSHLNLDSLPEIDASLFAETAAAEPEQTTHAVSDPQLPLQVDPNDPFRLLLQSNEERDFDRIFCFVRDQLRNNEEVSDFVRAASHWVHINDEHAHRIASFITEVTNRANIRDAVWYLEEADWNVDNAIVNYNRDVPRRYYGPPRVG